jgi:LmbE family N-acetylglucosaminyl deacetylase
LEFGNRTAAVFVPDGTPVRDAIARTTHLAVGAHQDDNPIMAYHGILECFAREDRWFLGVTVTDGGGSARSGPYAEYTDDQMQAVRAVEEKKAAVVGEFGALALLDYSSSAVKESHAQTVVEDLAALIRAARPDVVYTHNLADKHDTHVAVALRTIEALRRVPADVRPSAVYGCEVWRDLDWLNDDDKALFDVGAHGNLAAALLGVYDSQIVGGKRYDLATVGRRLAHATFSESHAVDSAVALSYAMDLTPLVTNPDLAPADHVERHIERMRAEISDRIGRLGI